MVAPDLGNHSFGPFWLTKVRNPGERISWQARCPWHKRSARLLCKRERAVRGDSEADSEAALRYLYFWCLAAPRCERCATHKDYANTIEMEGVPPMEVLRAQLESLPAPPDPAEVKTDVEFDHTAAVAAERGNQGQRPVRRRAPVAPARQPRRPRPAALGAGAVPASIPESNSLLEVAQRAGHQPSQPDREHSSNSSSGRGLSSGSGSSSSSSSSSSGSSSSSRRC